MFRGLLRRLPTLSPDKKRVWTPVVSAVGSAGFGFFLKIAQPGWQGIAGSIAWLLAAILVVVLVNRAGRYNRKALEAELKALLEYLDLPAETEARFAIWAPSIRKQEDILEQVTNYLPEGRSGAGRVLPASKGIVGYAFRNRIDKVNLLPEGAFPDTRSLQAHHVDRWGFSQEDARRLTQDRRAHLAVPVVDTDGAVLGIIYGDSSKADAFGAEVSASVVAIAPFFRQILLLEGE
jgi:hypothetical protein